MGLAELIAARDRTFGDPALFEEPAAEPRAVNEAMWTIDERIGELERAGDFGAEFADWARSAYGHRGRGAAIRRRFDERLRAEIIEEADAGGELAGSSATADGAAPIENCASDAGAV